MSAAEYAWISNTGTDRFDESVKIDAIEEELGSWSLLKRLLRRGIEEGRSIVGTSRG